MSSDPTASSAAVNPLKMFISWSGPAGRQVAESLRSYLENVIPGMTFWVSSVDIRSGAVWMSDIGGELTTVGAGIVIVTPDALKAPWLYFEAGALAKESLSGGTSEATLHPYLVDVDKGALGSTPLQGFFAVDATKEGTLELVRSIFERAKLRGLQQRSWEKQAEAFWPELEQDLAKIQDDFALRFMLSRLGLELGSASLNLLEGASEEEGSSFQGNPYLQSVVVRSLKGELARLKRLRESNDPFFSIPHNLYPAYVVSLLEEHSHMPMKAIALVDRDESFWQQLPAAKILEASNQFCMRVFAFDSAEHMRPYLNTLRSHARRYAVHAISTHQIGEIFPTPPYDFSICGELSSGKAILARYKHDPSVSWRSYDKSTKTIAFYSDDRSISEHHERFNEIVRASVKVDADFDEDGILEAVFRPDMMSRPTTRIAPVEMSAYIDIVNYKKHEGKHAYYPEMHGQMLAHLQDARRELGPKRMAVLELGAGTGHFTVKLAEAGNLDITTIEVDWACFNALKDTLEELEGTQKSSKPKSFQGMQRHVKDFATKDRHFSIPDLNVDIRCHCEDAREFDPGGPEGKFHCIVSSFADHHIAHADKSSYFDNVKANLEPGGVFIVGDEFLPPHDANSFEARSRALRSYHGHIIEATRKLHGDEAEGLVELEEGALDSGLKEIGDFKLTCEAYERHLDKAGFSFSKVRVGPADDALAQEVGGVYVYVMRVR